MGACTFVRSAGSDADKAEFSMNAPSGNGQAYRGVRGVLTPSNTYATGGDTIPLASVGLANIYEMLVDPVGQTDAQQGLSYKLGGTPSAPTLMAFKSDATGAGAGSQVAAGIDIDAHSVTVLLLGV